MKSRLLASTAWAVTGFLQPPEPPLRDEFLDPANNHELLRYYQTLRKKYLYSSNFGLALDDRDITTTGRPVPLNNLFVPPLVGARQLTPEDIIQWEGHPDSKHLQEVHQALRHSARLFLLGTPGTGKTTLIHWLILALTYSGNNHVKGALGQVIPFAFFLRDLPLKGVLTWEQLWERCVTQTGVELESTLLSVLVQNGQAFFLFDGLDEVADSVVRKGLGQALLDGMNRYQRCRFLVTSRPVGFSAASFFGLVEETAPEDELESIQNAPEFSAPHLYLTRKRAAKASGDEVAATGAVAPLLRTAFLAPFNTSQVKQFAVNWFSQYEPNTSVHVQRVTDLLDRVAANDGLSRLSRIPVLLNMICFIHARRARLPDGRVELYERIAQTYLVALDQARGLELPGKDLNVDYQDLSNWLATLALTMMQKRRGEEEGAVQVERKDIEQILSQGLEEKGLSEQECGLQCQAILRYFIRRSGFLVPVGQRQGEEVYAFNHLSFQEYFAARALDEKISFFTTEREWRELRTLLDQPQWQETFVLLFEMQPSVKRADHLADLLFGEKQQYLASNESENDKLSDLLPGWLVAVQVAMNTAVRLGYQRRDRLIKGAWGVANPYLLGGINIPDRRLFENTQKVISFLLHDRFTSLGHFREITSGQPRLLLSGVTIANLEVLGNLTNLQELDLSNTSVSDLQPLAQLINLKFLSLTNTSVNDIQPLAQLTSLGVLFLGNTSVNDIQPLAQLTSLEALFLTNTPVSDLQPL
ncbi:MAG: NACHT domain-containing protein, partial [Desulfobulbus sp.]|nr:NACHT domain-containing protein [Desulfobulbus sp.]